MGRRKERGEEDEKGMGRRRIRGCGGGGGGEEDEKGVGRNVFFYFKDKSRNQHFIFRFNIVIATF